MQCLTFIAIVKSFRYKLLYLDFLLCTDLYKKIVDLKCREFYIIKNSIGMIRDSKKKSRVVLVVVRVPDSGPVYLYCLSCILVCRIGTRVSRHANLIMIMGEFESCME